MDSGGEFHIEPLLDRLEKIHDEVVRDIESAERQHIFVIGPFALYHFDLEPLLLEESLLHRAEDGRFAGQSDVAHADDVGAAPGIGVFPATGEQESTESGKGDEFGGCHVVSRTRGDGYSSISAAYGSIISTVYPA